MEVEPGGEEERNCKWCHRQESKGCLELDAGVREGLFKEVTWN